MAPIVHCVRHAEVRGSCTHFLPIQLLTQAQGEHNKGGEAYLIPDPGLTKTGIEECQALEARFPFQSSVQLIVSSPMRRTLQTALCSFQPAIKRGIKIVALPELQETSDVACDTGSDATEIRREFSESYANIDFHLVEDGWNSKVGSWFVSMKIYILTKIPDWQMGSVLQCSNCPCSCCKTVVKATTREGTGCCLSWRVLTLPYSRLARHQT